MLKIEVGPLLKDILNRLDCVDVSPSCNVVIVIDQLNGDKTISIKFCRGPSFLAIVIQRNMNSLQFSFDKRDTRVASCPCKKNCMLIRIGNETKTST